MNKQGRYLLFLDILGFSQLTEEKKAEEIYSIIDHALKVLNRWEDINRLFKTIYFSDTFIFYQEEKGYLDRYFLDVYAIGGMILSALLAQGIAARGAISYGEFEVKLDSSNKHQVYFGNALIEAYKAEQRENWIGITILESAWRPWEANNTGCVKAFEKEKAWRKRHDGILMLNPFIKLRSWYLSDLMGEINKPYMEWDMPEFPNDIKGFKFLRDQAKDYSELGDFSGPIAVKYHSTIAFLRDILGKEMYEWGAKIYKSEQ